MLTANKIESITWKLLKDNDLRHEPINVNALAKFLDVQVSYERIEDEISAMLLIENKKANIVVNSSHHRNRKRFSLAHELGHFVLHASDKDSLFIDRSFFRNKISSIGESRQEIEANAFAGALLMPKLLIDKSIPESENAEIDTVRLAKMFEVSVDAMAIRLIKLGYVK